MNWNTQLPIWTSAQITKNQGTYDWGKQFTNNKTGRVKTNKIVIKIKDNSVQLKNSRKIAFET